MKRTSSVTPMGARSSEHEIPGNERETDHEIRGFLSRAEVCALTGLSATTIWREIRAGRFPQSVALSPNRKAFRASDISEWARNRTAKLQIQMPGR